MQWRTGRQGQASRTRNGEERPEPRGRERTTQPPGPTSLQGHEGCTPAAGAFAAEAVAGDAGEAVEQGVHGGAQGAGALAVNDANFSEAPGPGGVKIGGDQLAQIGGAKSVKIKFSRDGELDGGFFGRVGHLWGNQASAKTWVRLFGAEPRR